MKTYFATLLLLMSVCAAIAQQAAGLTTQDYERAESMMPYNTQKFVDNGNVVPNWITGETFWYRNLIANGSEFILVDAVKKTRVKAFDHEKLATSLSAAAGKTYTASMLPFLTFKYSSDKTSINFRVGKKQWNCDLKSYAMTEDKDQSSGQEQRQNQNDVISPDGKKAVFIKDYNLFLRDIQSGKVTQLTTDGVKNFGYATDNAGWKSSDKAVVTWSPDSKKLTTFKQDERNVGEMYLVTTNVGHPTLKAWKYPLPGDKEIATIQRVIIEVDVPKVIFLDIPADLHRSSLGDDIARGGELSDIDWTEDGTELAFLSTSRDHKQEKFRIANASTGKVREVFEEKVATHYESGHGGINWRYLEKTNEIIWYSERDNWGHLYLYDATTGKLKNQITKGDWLVTRLLKVDEKSRTVYFMATGTLPENPYFARFYKVGLDGKNLAVLTPEVADHSISLSKSGNYFVDNYSKPDMPTVSVLRDFNGKLITEIQKMDLSRLQATGWKPPIPISVKAHDGKTDLYGLMFTPTQLDPTKKYPIVDYIYPGPQGGGVGSWSFNLQRRSDHQSLAELGFIVVVIEGTSNPLRSKSYHDMNYGNMSENTLPDQVTGIQQLAKKYPYIDINRVGIWGHSGGGYATAAAMFNYPDFFKVGISESGNHDNRNYEDDWGERYIGLLTKNEDGSDSYEAHANQINAKNLKGKLMLAHGMMDNNVPPYNTFLVVEALEKENKDYDLVIFPNSAHGFGKYSQYMMRRRWDYFVEHLMGATHPKEYRAESKTDPRNPAE
ncbi:MAG TPA: DPP IV N-terminal domain-containing protein [Cyclobacteriaceae bacterium]|nr:DPP IV N-terminal domain-containing protein [Cyclobacteriaceae bacterium]